MPKHPIEEIHTNRLVKLTILYWLFEVRESLSCGSCNDCRYEVAAVEYKEAVKTLMNVDEDRENLDDKVHKITGILSKQTLDPGDKVPVTPVGKMNFFVNEVGCIDIMTLSLFSERQI